MNQKSFARFFRFAFVTLFFAAIAGSASAAGNFDAEFKAAAARYPRALQGMGSIGQISIGTLLRGIYSVRASVASESEIARLNGNGRSTCHWEIGEAGRTVKCSLFWWQRLREERPIMALHEMLGALGYDDENYVVSSGFWFLSDSTFRRLLRPGEEQMFTQMIARHAKVRYAGGVIGVGGGGQLLSVSYRMLTVRKAMSLLARPLNDHDRMEVLKAALILLEVGEDVTYTRGSNPDVQFQLQE